MSHHKPLTISHIMSDESRFVKKEKPDTNPYYKGTLFLSDAELSTSENWIDQEGVMATAPKSS